MNILSHFKVIKTFVFDVDGVLTDGTLLILKDGQMARRMNIKDGYALQTAVKKGYRVVIISGGTSEDVKERLQRLKITDVFMQVDNKEEFLTDYVNKNNLSWNEILFMGDDIPDYNCMKLVALACCPCDSVPEIKLMSKYISSYKGGAGCVRDVIEKVLKLNSNWDLDAEPPAV
ncbi:MAG: 3-deoxy-D-manno-octulosonate 8-phosphate phosphatase [Ginsengibacter sp.]